jgi:hypothetical protein
MKCIDCGEEGDDLHRVRIGRKTITLCDDCSAQRQEKEEVEDAAKGAIQDLMEYKGR